MKKEKTTLKTIYGTMWDTACNWLVSSGNKTQEDLLDAISWGNYNNTIAGHGSLQKTGYSEIWKVNNIYDLDGNAYEWTQELTPYSNHMRRGDDYSNNGSVDPVAKRYGLSSSSTEIRRSWRPALYHK